MKIEDIARVCHEANRALCQTHGDWSQLPWDAAQDWQKDSAIKGVRFRLKYPEAPTSAQHDAWRQDKSNDGWIYGPVKDAMMKTHPCMVPFEELPPEQQAKDDLFLACVLALSSVIDDDELRSLRLPTSENPTVPG